MELNVFMCQNLLICNPLNQNNISKSKSRVHIIPCTLDIFPIFVFYLILSFFIFFTPNFPWSLWGSITLVRTLWSRDSSAIRRDTADARGNLTLSGLDTGGGAEQWCSESGGLIRGTPVWGREVDLLGWQVVYTSRAHESAMF